MKTGPRSDMGMGLEEKKGPGQARTGTRFWQSFDIGIDRHSVIFVINAMHLLLFSLGLLGT